MMRSPSFRYVGARSLAESVKALADAGPDAMLLAGGTDLVPNLKRRQQTPSVLVSLKRVEELRQITPTRIGSGVTLAALTEDARLKGEYTALFRAAAQIATPHIRNMGTLGGNLCLDARCNYYNQSFEWRKAIDFCMKAPDGEARRDNAGGTCWVAPGSPRCWAVSSSDTAPALIALGARVTLVSTRGERDIALEDLYADDGMTYLTKRPDELLAWIDLPERGSWKSTYWKLRRRGSFDFPVLGVAAAVRFAGDVPGNVVEDVCVVLGAVASHPVRLAAARSLVGKPLTNDAIEAFANEASRFAKPLDNTDFALGWRKRVAKVFLAGVLRELRGDDPKELGLLARRASTLLPLG